mmetsp:Transcript_11742/g.25663  ORF Transcript_11742/g.25663 Transcript_11742/m.25663 type:complete len:272 (-) Transcript_11742:529-1344(-)
MADSPHMKPLTPSMYVLDSLFRARNCRISSTTGCRCFILSRSSSEVEWCLPFLEVWLGGGSFSSSKRRRLTCSGEATLMRVPACWNIDSSTWLIFPCSVTFSVSRKEADTTTPVSSQLPSRHAVGISIPLYMPPTPPRPRASSCPSSMAVSASRECSSLFTLDMALAKRPSPATSWYSERILHRSNSCSSSSCASGMSESHRYAAMRGSEKLWQVCRQKAALGRGADSSGWEGIGRGADSEKQESPAGGAGSWGEEDRICRYRGMRASWVL